MFAHIGAIVGLECLEIPIEGVHHDLAQGAALVAGEQRIPVRAPEAFDDVPTRAAELAFEFLDDFAVTPNRTVQALQIAVDDKNQVIEVLARGQADGAQRFNLVHFTIAAENPDLAVLGVGNAAGVEVLQEAGLVNGHQGAQAHGDGGELPEIRHELGVRIARQTLAIHFLPEMQQLLFCQTPFQISPGINPRGHVALDVNAVATVVFTLGMPEVVKARAKHVRKRGKGANVAAKVTPVLGVVTVGFDHHGHGVPAHVGAQALFNFNIARAMRLLVGFNGVDIARGGGKRHVDAVFAGVFEQLLKQKMRTVRSFGLNHGRERIHPFTRFLLIGIAGVQWLQVVGLCGHASLLLCVLNLNVAECRTKFKNFK